MKEKIREIILEEFKESDIKVVDGVDLNALVDRWTSNILALDEIADDDINKETVQTTQIALAHTAAVMLIAINAAPILVPLIVNPLLENAVIRKYVNNYAEAVPVKETDKTKTVLDITIERS